MSTIITNHIYAGNSNKYKRLALFISAFFILLFVISLGAEPSHTGYVKMQAVKYVISPALALASVYYWFMFFKSKRFELIVDQKQFSWTDTSGTTKIKWSDITEITMIRFDDESSRYTSYCSIKFKKAKANFGEGIELQLDNYIISINEFASLLEDMSSEYNFQFSQQHRA